MQINFQQNINANTHAPQYHLAKQTDMKVAIEELGGEVAHLCTSSTNAICGELGISETNDNLNVHRTDKVEEVTFTKKIYPTNNTLSIQRGCSEIYTKDYFLTYYGIKLHKNKN